MICQIGQSHSTCLGMLSIPKALSDSRILVTNDDGIHAPGLKALERAAKRISKDVWVVAPEVEQSGAAHSLTLNNPLRVRKISPRRYAVNGTPTDCVLLGVKEIVSSKKKVNLVLSGINRGCNVAEDITYSGTIAGAMEGALLEIFSIAVSQELKDGMPMHWQTGEEYLCKVIQKLRGFEMPSSNLLSVNIPNVLPNQVKAIAIARQGRRKFEGLPDKRFDPKGREYYWIGGTGFNQKEDHPDSDHAMMHAGYVTVTPLSLELTNRPLIQKLNLLFAKKAGFKSSKT